MAPRVNRGLPPPDSARMAHLRKEARKLQRFRTEAADNKSWSAVAAFSTRIDDIRLQYDHARAEIRSLGEDDDHANVAALSPAEWAERIQEDARAASDVDLEHYVREWLGRNGWELTQPAPGSTAPPGIARASLQLVGG